MWFDRWARRRTPLAGQPGARGKVAKVLMEGKLRWMAKDVYGDVPVKYRDYAKNTYVGKGAEDLAAK